jgi:hypothetical protein
VLLDTGGEETDSIALLVAYPSALQRRPLYRRTVTPSIFVHSTFL